LQLLADMDRQKKAWKLSLIFIDGS